jgi:hypothetical protein
MFYRILGKFFLFFVIIPDFLKFYEQFLRPALKAGLLKAIEDDRKKTQAERAKSRADHPAGTRRPE